MDRLNRFPATQSVNQSPKHEWSLTSLPCCPSHRHHPASLALGCISLQQKCKAYNCYHVGDKEANGRSSLGLPGLRLSTICPHTTIRPHAHLSVWHLSQKSPLICPQPPKLLDLQFPAFSHLAFLSLIRSITYPRANPQMLTPASH